MNCPGVMVSVIMPVYNGEQFIETAVDNVMAQKYPSLELIIVNDGSTDGTEERIRHLSGPIRYIKQENEGPACARNRGIESSYGPLIAFLDVDDIWPANTLNVLVQAMLCNPEVEITRGRAQHMQYNAQRGAYDFVGDSKETFPYSIPSALYRRSIFDKVGLFDASLRFGEDTDWFIRAAELNVNIKQIETVTLLVRRHGENMTSGKNLVELNTLRVVKKILDRARKRGGGV